MNSQDTNKTSEQLHQEVHGQIDKIGSNIDNVRNRMSPGNLLDDAIFYPHGQSLTGTYNHLKNNPMGSMFLSLGTLLLMEDQNHVTYESKFKDSASEAWTSGKERLQEKSEAFSEKTSELKAAASEKAHRAKDRFSHKKEEFKREAHEYSSSLESKLDSGEGLVEKARRLKDKGMEKLGRAERKAESEASSQASHLSSQGRHLKDEAREKFDHAKQSARQGIDHAKTKAKEAGSFVQDIHPFAIASVGLGLGASFGASLPMGRVEEKFQGPEYRAKIERLSKDFDDAIRESGERIKSSLIDELKNFNFH